MAKWIFTVLLSLISIFTFKAVTDDQGVSIGDWVKYPFIIAGLLFALLALIFWFRSFLKDKKIISFFFSLLPIILTAFHFYLYYKTREKVNKEYFLFATNPDEHAHQFKYYFRTDSTLKTNGIFFWNEANDFQKFSMKGDTIYLDTILPATGIQSKIYLKTIKTNSDGQPMKLLVPLDINHKPIDSLRKFVIEMDKNYP